MPCARCDQLMTEAMRLGRLGLRMKGERDTAIKARDAAQKRVRELEAALAIYRAGGGSDPVDDIMRRFGFRGRA